MTVKTRTVKLSDAHKDLDALVDAASKGERIVLERDGAPAVALLSGREYELFLQMAARREELFKAVDATRKAMKDVPYEEAEREINEFITKMRGRPAAQKPSKASA